MHLSDIPFVVTEWQTIAPTEHPGDAGTAWWRTRQFGAVRVRLVTYSPGYIANHWCRKGHILFCLEGTLDTELAEGRRFHLTPGMSYQVADDDAPHRSRTPDGATLFIVD